ncbi:MAG TPA: GNAT family N-acetyltransferase [Candidatus Acidoferrales bacterium]|nr:GNAT family N-acetyltransferase [Candidatus Acidoferrales bacterium]
MDSDAIAALLAKCDGAARWSAGSIAAALKAGAICWIAERDRGLAGMILIRLAADEMEILNLGVSPQDRRKGIATRLLMQALRHGAQHGVTRAYLEVRSKNEAGRNFYAANSFRADGGRENYYTAPSDDAILMSRALKRFDGKSL